MEPIKNSIDAKLVQEFWRLRAQQEDSRWTPKTYLDFEIETMQQLRKNRSSMNILDLGSGSGSLSRNLTNQSDKLTAVDFEPSFQKFFLNESRFNFIHDTVDQFISKEKYDLILLFGVVTHLNQTAESVTYKNMASMLRESGVVVVKNQCSDSEEFIFNGYSRDLGVNYSARYPNINDQRNRLQKHFTNVEILEYPEWSKKYPNTSHLMFICKNSHLN
jgi:cyclopropane fatty-acyl-phospholipid synthase-like methyltransferase